MAARRMVRGASPSSVAVLSGATPAAACACTRAALAWMARRGANTRRRARAKVEAGQECRDAMGLLAELADQWGGFQRKRVTFERVRHGYRIPRLLVLSTEMF